MAFEQCHKGCPQTCASKNDSLSCEQLKTDGCFCPEGKILKDGDCVTIEKCGKIISNTYEHFLSFLYARCLSLPSIQTGPAFLFFVISNSTVSRMWQYHNLKCSYYSPHLYVSHVTWKMIHCDVDMCPFVTRDIFKETSVMMFRWETDFKQTVAIFHSLLNINRWKFYYLIVSIKTYISYINLYSCKIQL